MPQKAQLGIELRSSERPAGKSGVLERLRIRVRNGVEVETGGPLRDAISIAAADFAALVLGGISADTLFSAGRLKPSSKKALAYTRLLFPGDTWCRPPLDDLLA